MGTWCRAPSGAEMEPWWARRARTSSCGSLTPEQSRGPLRALSCTETAISPTSRGSTSPHLVRVTASVPTSCVWLCRCSAVGDRWLCLSYGSLAACPTRHCPRCRMGQL
ncbi:CORO7 isoform 12 [Pan troglodytes]|uniref:CORO7 isoform 12 n=1 Tax=Pan troglodytes TaxID=9598 RepID=A0A2J8LAS7_PANTR|nr:CORO7 isoform 12 [Pan troglodytes]